MKKDIYIPLYHKIYNEQLIICHKFIKKELIQHAMEHHDDVYASNGVLKELSAIKNHLVAINEDYRTLIRDFDNRTDIYSDEHQYDIIFKKLHPAFIEINNPLEDFENFIIDIATLNAYKEASRLFANNSAIYRRIYELNRFDLIQTDTYLPLKTNSKLKKKLYDGSIGEKPLNECVTKEDTLELKEYYNFDRLRNKIDSDNVERVGSMENINFKIKVGYKEIFTESYDFFTEHFVDKDQVSKGCFKSVFFKDTNSHDFTLNFFCDNGTAAYLLFNLGKKLFSELTFVNIDKSKKFISSGGTEFRKSNLTHSKKNCSLDSKDLVHEFIVKLLISKI